MPDNKEIGKLIPGYLIKNNMSVKAFSEKLNVSRITIWKWINGKTTPSYLNYLKLLSVLREV